MSLNGNSPHYKDSRSGSLGDKEYGALARIVRVLLILGVILILVLCVTNILW